MQSVKIVLAAFIAIVISFGLFGQKQKKSVVGMKTETFKVWGNCESCKARIEKAARIEGVSNAEWNVKTKMLTLVYDPSKVKSDDVLKKIASVGHDNEKFKAEDKTYNSLPGCCQYEREK